MSNVCVLDRVYSCEEIFEEEEVEEEGRRGKKRNKKVQCESK